MHTKTPRLILYIEDVPELIELLRSIFNDERFVLKAAMTGQQGLRLVRQLRPDLVLLDLMLPDLGGWDIVDEMQQDPLLRDIPVIVITVLARPPVETAGYDRVERLAGYLVKPFSVRELRRKVQEALGVTLS